MTTVYIFFVVLAIVLASAEGVRVYTLTEDAWDTAVALMISFAAMFISMVFTYLVVLEFIAPALGIGG